MASSLARHFGQQRENLLWNHSTSKVCPGLPRLMSRDAHLTTHQLGKPLVVTKGCNRSKEAGSLGVEVKIALRAILQRSKDQLHAPSKNSLEGQHLQSQQK